MKANQPHTYGNINLWGRRAMPLIFGGNFVDFHGNSFPFLSEQQNPVFRSPIRTACGYIVGGGRLSLNASCVSAIEVTGTAEFL
jgi:hypothetical protein